MNNVCIPNINIDELLEESIQTALAMNTLACSYNHPYGVGHTFTLQTEDTVIHSVTIERTFGEGGSKKTALLNDGQVLMLPNIDQGSLRVVSSWWPESVDKESGMATFLQSINVPTLNRQKGYLFIPSSNPDITYQLPVMLSDSFAQYAERGCFIMDNKNMVSSHYSNNEWQHWDKFGLTKWKEAIAEMVPPLVQDLWILETNDVSLSRDSSNMVMIENDQGFFELHYFGFDFGGKYGSKIVPSEEMRAKALDRPDADICSRVASTLEPMIDNFVYFRIEKQFALKGMHLDTREKSAISAPVAKHYANCDYILKHVSQKEVFYDKQAPCNPIKKPTTNPIALSEILSEASKSLDGLLDQFGSKNPESNPLENNPAPQGVEVPVMPVMLPPVIQHNQTDHII